MRHDVMTLLHPVDAELDSADSNLVIEQQTQTQ